MLGSRRPATLSYRANALRRCSNGAESKPPVSSRGSPYGAGRNDLIRERSLLDQIRLRRQAQSVPFLPPPRSAAWAHQDARSGFEVVYCQPHDDGHLLTGATTAVEHGQSWIVDYEIRVDAGWRTRAARVTGHSCTGARTRLLEGDGEGRWRIDSEPAPQLDGCLDVDLESSAMTNTLPVHRLALTTGATAQAPAAYVRALDLSVERLEQQYTRTTDLHGHQRYDYTAPAFDFSCQLVYDEAGLVLAYPGIAVRTF